MIPKEMENWNQERRMRMRTHVLRGGGGCSSKMMDHSLFGDNDSWMGRYMDARLLTLTF